MKRFRVRDRINLLIVAAVFVSLSASVYGADAPDLRGVYWATEYRARIQLVGGGELPLTPKGRAVYEKNMAGLKNGSILDEARMVCTPDGPVRNFATPYPFEILTAAPGQVLMIHELNHQIRAIALDTPVPKLEDLMILPFYSGYSYGRYEGDTLVVETLGFKEQTFLDATGAPHTDELITTERIRKISPNQLEIVITVHDPEYYTRDWQTRFVYALRNDIEIEDYICGEPHRDLSSVAGIRRP